MSDDMIEAQRKGRRRVDYLVGAVERAASLTGWFAFTGVLQVVGLVVGPQPRAPEARSALDGFVVTWGLFSLAATTVFRGLRAALSYWAVQERLAMALTWRARRRAGDS